MPIWKPGVELGVHLRAVAKLSEHCAKLAGVWWGAAAAAADAMQVCI